MRKIVYLFIYLFVGMANASSIGFVSNPTTNTVDWATQVSTLGGSINSNVNFDAMSTGALNGGFYTGSDGVTLLASGDVSNVQFGAGPGQGNTSGSILGEGLHAASNYLLDSGAASSLIISFNTSVLGVGLDIIDYFNPTSDNPLTIEAFTGQNGLGASLGIYSSVGLNFQRNGEYFMGLISTDNNIGSLIFTDVNSVTGDITGIDNIVFATTSETNQVPEPTSLGLLALGLASTGFSRKMKIRNP